MAGRLVGVDNRGIDELSMEMRDKVQKVIKDSGQRTEFPTGAVRDMGKNKGRCDLLPMVALLRLSRHYEAGAAKYGLRNWEKGIPVSSFMDSALRHLMCYMAGWDDEDHLAAAAFNVLGAMQMEEVWPDMLDLPMRDGRRDYSYRKQHVEAKKECSTCLYEGRKPIAIPIGICGYEHWRPKKAVVEPVKERDCKDCVHEKINPHEKPCKDCHCYSHSPNWQPKKTPTNKHCLTCYHWDQVKGDTRPFGCMGCAWLSNWQPKEAAQCE